VFVAESTHPLRRSVALVMVVMLLAAAASVAAAQRLDEGPEAGGPAARAPEYDSYARTVAVWPSAGDDTARLIEAITICAAARVGCTVTLAPGVYTLRWFELAGFSGTLAVGDGDLQLIGLFTPMASLRFASVYHQVGHERWPTTVGITP
jgi:hypothetical protein